MYHIFFYHGFGEAHYHAFHGITDYTRAIQQARDYKRTKGDRGDFFEVYEDGRSVPVYHSIFGAWDDPRLP